LAIPIAVTNESVERAPYAPCSFGASRSSSIGVGQPDLLAFDRYEVASSGAIVRFLQTPSLDEITRLFHVSI
jgi:hypothetical protein